MATASFKMLSPKIIEYSLGSTLSTWNMESTVTGSVADKTDPKIIESKNESCNEPIPIADNIPTKTLYMIKKENNYLN